MKIFFFVIFMINIFIYIIKCFSINLLNNYNTYTITHDCEKWEELKVVKRRII